MRRARRLVRRSSKEGVVMYRVLRLRYGNPWEIPRPEYQIPVNLYGRVIEQNGKPKWVDSKVCRCSAVTCTRVDPSAGDHGDAVRHASSRFQQQRNCSG